MQVVSRPTVHRGKPVEYLELELAAHLTFAEQYNLSISIDFFGPSCLAVFLMSEKEFKHVYVTVISSITAPFGVESLISDVDPPQEEVPISYDNLGAYKGLNVCPLCKRQTLTCCWPPKAPWYDYYCTSCEYVSPRFAKRIQDNEAGLIFVSSPRHGLSVDELLRSLIR